VIRDDVAEAQKRAYILADNKLAENAVRLTGSSRAGDKF
jgi:hypothetical protein